MSLPEENRELVINVTNTLQIVDIIMSDGSKTSVNIMPKSRVHLEEGATMCTNWEALNLKAVKQIKPKVTETSKVENKSFVSTKTVEAKSKE